MITILGGSQRSGVWGYLELPSVKGPTIEYTLYAGPYPMRLPPNNGKWYPCGLGSPYGIRGSSVHIGKLISESGKSEEHSCYHRNANGVLLVWPDTPENSDMPHPYDVGYTPFGYETPSTGGNVVAYRNVYGTDLAANDTFKPNGERVHTTWSPYPKTFRAPSDDFAPTYPGVKLLKYGDEVYSQLGGPLSENDHWFRRKTLWFNPKTMSPFTRTTNYAYSWPFGKVELYEYETRYELLYIRSLSGYRYEVRLGRKVVGFHSRYLDTSNPWREILDESDMVTALFQPCEPGLVQAAGSAVALSSLSQHLDSFEKAAQEVPLEPLSAEAHNEALGDVDELKSNYIENASGLSGSFSVIGDLLRGAAAVADGNPMGAARALAGAYLWYKFALAPTLSDVEDLADNGRSMVELATANRFNQAKQQGSVSQPFAFELGVGSVRVTTTLKLSLDPSPFAQLWQGLAKVGLEPSIANMWDLIPMSFVIDWFTDYGDVLDNLSKYWELKHTRSIDMRIESAKTNCVYPEGAILPSTGNYGGRILGEYEELLYLRGLYSDLGAFDKDQGVSAGGINYRNFLIAGSLVTVLL